MILSKLRPICFMLLIVTAVSCKKDNSSNIVGSGGDIVLSVNGGSDIHYDKPTNNLGTETNYKSGVSFARTYYITAPTSSSEQENAITFALQDENIFQQPLPYQVKNITVVVDINIPSKLGNFAYNSSSAYGKVNVTVTSAKGTTIKGTYSGVVYNSGYFPPQPDSIRISGSFDVTLPAYYGD